MLKLVVSSQGRLNQTYILSNIAQFDKNYSWIFFLEFYKKKNGLKSNPTPNLCCVQSSYKLWYLDLKLNDFSLSQSGPDHSLDLRAVKRKMNINSRRLTATKFQVKPQFSVNLELVWN